MENEMTNLGSNDRCQLIQTIVSNGLEDRGVWLWGQGESQYMGNQMLMHKRLDSYA